MTTDLIVLGDESGTMPEGDSDQPFCAAAIASISGVPVPTTISGHKKNVTAACADLSYVPQVVFVRPGPGYEQQLRAKMSKADTMARASRLVTGSHIYLPETGHNTRNLIWIRCVLLSLTRAVIRAKDVSKIQSIVVVLDQKTLGAPHRLMFSDLVCDQCKHVLGRTSIGYKISVLWSDESAAAPFEDGLLLAHHVSKLAWKALKRREEAALAEDFSLSEIDLFYDATPDVLAPPPRGVVEKWKRNTGLPEPSE